MIMRSRSRWIALVTATVSLVVLAACAGINQKSVPVAKSSTELKIEDEQQKAEKRAAQLGLLKKDVQATKAQTEANKKKLLSILAESDSALRAAQQYSSAASKQRNLARKTEFAERATKAQELADQKSKELVTLRSGVYSDLGRIRVMNQQVNTLAAEDRRDEKVAKAEAKKPGKGKRNSSQLAERARKQM